MLCPTHPRTCTCMHTYFKFPYRLIPSLASTVLYRSGLVLEIEPLTETILHAQRAERFVFVREAVMLHVQRKCEIGLH